MKRYIIRQRDKLSILQITGVVLLFLGILGLLFIAIYSFAGGKAADGSLAAVSFFLIMIGFSLVFPDLLRSKVKDGYSTMRVATFMIVSVFVFLCVKIAWGCGELKDFKVDTTWGYILLAALGSKAVQSLGESRASGKSAGPLAGTVKGGMTGEKPDRRNPSPGPPASTVTALVHDQGTLANKPPIDPPPFITAS